MQQALQSYKQTYKQFLKSEGEVTATGLEPRTTQFEPPFKNRVSYSKYYTPTIKKKFIRELQK